MKSWLHYVFCASLFISLETASAAPIRRALVIGNDSYPGNSLHNARNDARGIDNSLTTLGYVSTLVLDADRRSMSNAVDDFTRTIASGDTALVYYAGHGLQAAGENYLIPIDFHAKDLTDVSYQGYPLGAILSKIAEHGASTQIVILDACRDNPFIPSRSLGEGWAGVSTSAGTFLAFGTAPGSTASDDPSEPHGLFTQSLLRHVNSASDVEQTFQKVREEVIRASNGKQVPWTSSSLIGTFHLDPREDATAPPLRVERTSTSAVTGDSSERSLYQSRSKRGTASSQVSAHARDTPKFQDAFEQIQNRNFAAAAKALQSVLALFPESSLAFRLLGVVLHLDGRDIDARAALDRAIAIDPQDAIAYSYRCLIAVGSPGQSSENDCRQAVRLRADLSAPHLGLALNLANANRGIEAQKEASQAVSLDSSSTVALSVQKEVEGRDPDQGPSQNR